MQLVRDITRLALLGCAVAATFFFTHCTQRRPPAGAGQSLRLRWAIERDPQQMDWIRCREVRCVQHVSLIMRGLTRLSFVDGKVRPAPDLAISWEASSKGIVFRLNSAAVWSDGEPLRASHFSSSWKETLLHCREMVGSPLLLIRNARAYCEGKVSAEKVGIEIRDPHTLSIEFASTHPNLALLFSHPTTWPTRGRPEVSPTLGPFIVQSWQKGKGILYRRNPHFQGEVPQLSFIEAKVVESAGSRVQMFQDGEIDLADDLPARSVVKFGRGPGLMVYPTFRIVSLHMLSSRRPFHLSQVRSALEQVIDRTELATLTGEYFLPADHLLALPSAGVEVVKPNPESARKLLAELKLELPLPHLNEGSVSDLLSVMSNLEAQWIKSLDLKNEGPGKATGQGGISLVEFYADPYSPTRGFERLPTPQSISAESLLKQAAGSETQEAQERWLLKFEEALRKDSIFMPLLYRTRLALQRAEFHHLERSPMEIWNFRAVTK